MTKPSMLDPSSWPHANQAYGRSPMMAAVDAIKVFEAAVPDPEERRQLLAAASVELMQIIADEEADEL